MYRSAVVERIHFLMLVIHAWQVQFKSHISHCKTNIILLHHQWSLEGKCTRQDPLGLGCWSLCIDCTCFVHSQFTRFTSNYIKPCIHLTHTLMSYSRTADHMTLNFLRYSMYWPHKYSDLGFEFIRLLRYLYLLLQILYYISKFDTDILQISLDRLTESYYNRL